LWLREVTAERVEDPTTGLLAETLKVPGFRPMDNLADFE
jgi:hypothetical protein